jgi:hypothetical protein
VEFSEALDVVALLMLLCVSVLPIFSMAGESSAALRLDPSKWMAKAVATKQTATSRPILTGVFTRPEIIKSPAAGTNLFFQPRRAILAMTIFVVELCSVHARHPAATLAS